MTLPAADTLRRRLKPLEGAPEGALVLHEIYASIQGESSYAGLPCTFIRTTACHLRCTYCDTPHAFTEGKPYTQQEVLREVERLGHRLVEITGGEPLLQPAVLPLMSALCDAGHTVLLETSGACDIRPVDPRVVRIVDLKTPSSGERDRNLPANITALARQDEVKIVIGSREDYDWARSQLEEHRLHERCTVLMGVVWGALAERDLAAWILADGLPVRMQVQLHKHLWDPEARGV